VAPGWPGDPESVEQAHADPVALANRGIDEVTENYAKLIAALDEKPVP
jgi:hypothetical protein